MSFKVPEKYRVVIDSFKTILHNDGNNGVFIIPKGYNGKYFSVIASDGSGWEHVSVSLPSRCPTWEEMCIIKDLFWDKDDCVVQFHPPESEYVNNHPYCLHLWRKAGKNQETPPSIFVGIKGENYDNK